jgi:hypothetical protein
MNRQLILIVFALGTLVYAGSSLLGGAMPDPALAGQSIEAMATAAAGTAQQALKAAHGDQLSPEAEAVLVAAQEAVNASAFAPPPEQAQAMAASGSKEAGAFSYHGYLDMGASRVAVINGNEYVEGEELVGGIYAVTRIRPSKVTLTPLIGGPPLVVPYAE